MKWVKRINKFGVCMNICLNKKWMGLWCASMHAAFLSVFSICRLGNGKSGKKGHLGGFVIHSWTFSLLFSHCFSFSLPLSLSLSLSLSLTPFPSLTPFLSLSLFLFIYLFLSFSLFLSLLRFSVAYLSISKFGNALLSWIIRKKWQSRWFYDPLLINLQHCFSLSLSLFLSF